jgi:hypothetical protein
MVLNPSSDATSYLTTQEFSNIFRKLKAHDRVHKSLTLVPIPI